jgi:predicted GIY-YIG superfamily endonuclease
LVERFGTEFFRSVPECPGVYLLCGTDAGVLYVGKAKNLRRRLGSYRSAKPERLKLRRLFALVRRIHWDECRDEKAALERERELLLTLKPRFNTIGTYPSPKVYVGWQRTERGLALGCSDSTGDWTQGFGPLSSGRFLHGAVLRLLWWTLHPTLGWERMPKALSRVKTPLVWEFAGDPAETAEICQRLDEFFQGTSPELVEWFVVSAAWRPGFERAWIARDALRLLEHFERLVTPERDPSRLAAYSHDEKFENLPESSNSPRCDRGSVASEV